MYEPLDDADDAAANSPILIAPIYTNHRNK